MATGLQISQISLSGHADNTDSSKFLESPTLFRQFRITSDITTSATNAFINANLEESGTTPQGGYGFKGVGTMSAASAATATITVNDPGPNAGDTIILRSTGGLLKTYTGHADTTAEGSNQFSVAGSNTDIAQALKSCIVHASGHNGEILVSGSSNILTLTQRDTGTNGNNLIINAGSPLSNVVSSSQFSGGRDGGEMIFPQTGVYLVSCTANIQRASADVSSLGISIFATGNFDDTADSISYVQLADAFGSVHTDAPKMTLHASTPLDVSDTSKVVAKFRWDSNGVATIQGDTALNKTYFQYLRVGST
tara:strand:+ start:3871 stop:4797 length:927 start_codon:yes stop_codon:yes gene_type:complete